MNYQIYSGPIVNKDKMDLDAQMSFEGGYQTVLLSAGFVLWRFVAQLKNNRFGRYWIDGTTMTHIMNELQEKN